MGRCHATAWSVEDMHLDLEGWREDDMLPRGPVKDVHPVVKNRWEGDTLSLPGG